MGRFQINIRTVIITVVFTFFIMLILLYAPSPFVVTKPGIAVSTEQFVSLTTHNIDLDAADTPSAQNTQNENSNEEGQLFLTAVLLETPNIWKSIAAMFEPGSNVSFKADVLGGASIEEYANTVKTTMKGSHQNALEAAYRYLSIDYSIKSQQVTVQQVNHQAVKMPLFKDGDIIVAGIDSTGEQVDIQSIADLAAWLKLQAANGKIMDGTSLIVQRDEEQLFIALDDIELDNGLSDEKMLAEALVVHSFVELRDVVPNDERYKLTITTDNIGGPSAGLVFALTVIDKLTAGDLTKGKQIAATGTIDPAGNVGAIGGIVQKVYTTSKQGVDLFLVPKKNERAATRTLKKLDTSMQIVGVSSLEEAIQVITSFQ